MTRFWNAKRVGLFVAPLLVSLAAEPAKGEPEPNSALSFSGGVDASSAYYYNGIPQIDQGVAIQPWAELGIQLCEGVGVTFGTWNSIHNESPPHTQPAGKGNPGTGSGNPWYESDFYTGVSFGLPQGFTLSINYVYLHSPNRGFQLTEELQFLLEYDDSELLGDLALSPSIQISHELEAGSDAPTFRGHEGTLLLLGIEPSVTVMKDSDYPLSLSLPIKVGINVDDYYETGLSSQPRVDHDETFGFADVGVAANVPLTFIPEQYGAWSAGASFHFMFLGDSAQEIGGLKGVSHDFSDLEVYAMAGITVEM